MTIERFKFKQVYPNYATFNAEVVSRATRMYGATVIDAEPFYFALLNRYANAEIAYDTRTLMHVHFAETFADNVGKYEYVQGLIKQSYKKTLEDIAMDSTEISASGFNNSTILQKPLDEMQKYIDAQSGKKIIREPVQRLYDVIREAKTLLIGEFLDDCRKHFTQILSIYEYMYKKRS